MAKPQSAGTFSGSPVATIVIAKNQKRLKWLRSELRMAQPRGLSHEIDVLVARNVWPGGPIPPKR